METLLLTLGWSVITIMMYLASKSFYRLFPRWWTTPLALTPLVMAAIMLLAHEDYTNYIRGTHWLVMLLGPATVAFSVPIYEQRALVLRHWRVLLLGMVAGSAAAMLSSWGLATALGVGGDLRLSLLPRSMSTPFAMTVSSDIGGVPNLTAVFVVFTGVLGAALGENLLRWLPLRSSLARGALFGLGAHGAGVAKAHQVGREEGAVASLVMVLVGLLNVLMAPVLAMVLR